jgi:transposase
MPSYSAFLRRLQLLENILNASISSLQPTNDFFIVDSTPFEVCKTARYKRSRLFKEDAAWAISSTKKVYGIKLHLAINDANRAVNFSITKGSISDVSMAEKLLEGRMGTAIGDKGYVSEELRIKLKNRGMNFIVRARKNMKMQNSDEEVKLLAKRHKVETFFGKLKIRLGESFSRFRSWKAVSAAIAIGIMTLNLGL